MADGYARASQKFGFCLGIAGPGAINFAPALAAAFADQIPILAISGGIPRYLESKGAFQDSTYLGVNDVAVLEPITKFSARISTIENLRDYLRHALQQMASEDKGPVYIQIPQDVQNANYQFTPHNYIQNVDSFIDDTHIEYVKKAIRNSEQKTVIIVGSRALNYQFSQNLLKLAEEYDIPIASTLCAKGAFPEDHPLSLGTFGFAGNHRANEVLLSGDIDNIISFGVDFNQRNSMAWSKKLRAKQLFIQIEPISTKLSHHEAIDIGIKSDCSSFLKVLKNKLEQGNLITKNPASIRQLWLDKILLIGKYYDMTRILNSNTVIHPAKVIIELRKIMPRNTIVSVDSGMHRIFAAHYWESYEPHQYLTSASTAPMGWAIAAGIGAKLAKPKHPSVVITGDGCMLMHGNEIQTAARYNIPVIFIVLNNSAHGAIHIDSDKNRTFDGTLTELPSHDWSQYAQALGLTGYTIKNYADMTSIFKEALNLNKACLIDIHCSAEYKAPNYCYIDEAKALTKEYSTNK